MRVKNVSPSNQRENDEGLGLKTNERVIINLNRRKHGFPCLVNKVSFF